MAGRRILLILNTKAGRFKSKSVLYDCVMPFCENGDTVTLAVTAFAGHAVELAQESTGYDMIVCCGGDGTLNEVVQGVMNAKKQLPIGYIPAGSTNDFASSMNLESNVRKAVDSILNGEETIIDIGSFNGRYFTYIASFGAFTATSYSTPQSWKNTLGRFAYFLEGIKELSKIKAYHVRAVTENETLEDDYIFGSVSNSTSVAGIVHLDEDFVDMNDGLLEVLLVKMPKNIGEVNQILMGVANSDFSGDMFAFFKTPSIRLESNGGFPWTLDGERADGSETVEIMTIPDAVRIIKQ